MRRAYKSGYITKQQANKWGYNKFLEISRDIEFTISEQKNAEECRWNGFKGYITNTDLDAERVIAEYHGLWVVERVFRISKRHMGDAPDVSFHRKKDRGTYLYLLYCQQSV